MIGICFLILIIIYFYFICPRIFRKPDYSPLLGKYYAHRGLHDNASEAPENSLLAIHKAVEAGYGIEFDVQLSKDDIPVVFHDASLKRVCGIDGNVWEYTLEELQKMTLVNSTQTIPTLEEVLKVVDGKVPLIIEYKMDRPDTKVCELGDAILQQYQGVYCVESFHPFAVKWYRKHRPEIIRGQLCTNYWKDGKHPKNALYFMMTYLMGNVMTRPDFIAYCHTYEKNLSRYICKWLGALQVTWTVRSQEEFERVKDKFDLFIFENFILK